MRQMGTPVNAAPATHGFEEHTGEVQLRVEAGSLRELFEEAARALAELAHEGPTRPTQPEETVSVRASDREALLVEWLNELVFLSETRRRVYPSVHVDELTDTTLKATVCGFETEEIRTAVKAATLHEVCVHEREGRWTANVVLDV
jgi:protein archease